jgi:hypothetical protein
MPAAANPSDPRGIMRMVRIVPQRIVSLRNNVRPLSRNQSNSVACKEAAAIRGCANAATAMAHRRGTFCAERCGESATDHVRINGLPGSGMIDVTECRELATECRQMADRAQTFRVRSILIDIARTWDRLALELEHSTARITPKQVLRPRYEIFTRK